MAGRWRKRFAEDGLSGIEKNLPRGNNHGGKNTRAQARLRQKIIAKTTTEKPPNATHWSTRTLAEVLGTSHNFVAKVWRECGFKPHLISQFKISNDPHLQRSWKMWWVSILAHLIMRLFSASTRKVRSRRWIVRNLVQSVCFFGTY